MKITSQVLAFSSRNSSRQLLGSLQPDIHFFRGFPGGASSKGPTCQCRRQKRCGFSPWVGKIPWRKAQQPTPVFLPGESHGQRSLAGYSPQDHTELDMAEVIQHICMHPLFIKSSCTLKFSCLFICLCHQTMKSSENTLSGFLVYSFTLTQYVTHYIDQNIS